MEFGNLPSRVVLYEAGALPLPRPSLTLKRIIA